MPNDKGWPPTILFRNKYENTKLKNKALKSENTTIATDASGIGSSFLFFSVHMMSFLDFSAKLDIFVEEIPFI